VLLFFKIGTNKKKIGCEISSMSMIVRLYENSRRLNQSGENFVLSFCCEISRMRMIVHLYENSRRLNQVRFLCVFF